MIDVENELGDRLHRIADAATIEPDLAGVKDGRVRRAGSRPTTTGRTRRTRLAFVAAVAAVILGGVVVVSQLGDQEVDVASEAEDAGQVDDADQPAAPPVAEALPTVYLQAEGIRPLSLSINRWPDIDASDAAWELKSIYELRATDFPDDQGESYPLSVFAVPTAVAGVFDLDDQLADLRSNGIEVERVSVGDRDGWTFSNSEHEKIRVLFETEHHVVTMLFWPDADDETMARTLAVVGDDLAGFQRVAADERLDQWVLAAVDNPGPELTALFPSVDNPAEDEDPQEVDGDEALLHESDLAGGEFTYTLREVVDNGTEQLDIDEVTADVGCQVLGELIVQVSAIPHRSAEFTGSNGWGFGHGVLDVDRATDEQILEDFRRVGAECDQWADLSSADTAAFGQDNFFLAAYLFEERLFFIELENGTDQTGPDRLAELLATVRAANGQP